MKLLQKLINDKKQEGKSYHQIAKESGIDYRSIRNYHRDGQEPRGENLALLAKYFNTHFADLLDDYVPDAQISPLKRQILSELDGVSDEVLRAVRDLLRAHHKRG